MEHLQDKLSVFVLKTPVCICIDETSAILKHCCCTCHTMAVINSGYCTALSYNCVCIEQDEDARNIMFLPLLCKLILQFSFFSYCFLDTALLTFSRELQHVF